MIEAKAASLSVVPSQWQLPALAGPGCWENGGQAGPGCTMPFPAESWQPSANCPVSESIYHTTRVLVWGKLPHGVSRLCLHHRPPRSAPSRHTALLLQMGASVWRHSKALTLPLQSCTCSVGCHHGHVKALVRVRWRCPPSVVGSSCVPQPRNILFSSALAIPGNYESLNL